MKNIKQYKRTLRDKGLIFHTGEEVFRKHSKSKKFRHAYDEERARLKLASRLRELRLNRKFTQKALAEKIHMPQSVVARLESGEHSFSLGTLQRVAHAFNKEIQLV